MPQQTSPSGYPGTDSPQGWQAELELGFKYKYGKTVLAQRRHSGPLTVQRPFYPEGEVCHVYILHPPGGVVAGDHLAISLHAAANSSALVTTPAAGKFYRSDGLWASQQLTLTVATDASLEWLPQETIVYQGAQVVAEVRLELAEGARFIGWEILALGRPAAQEGFLSGQVAMNWQLFRAGELFYRERLLIDAHSFAANWGLQGHSTCGVMYLYPANIAQRAVVQTLIGDKAGYAVTLLEDILICRGLDSRADQLRDFFQTVWRVLRPDIIGREVCAPRIWST